MVGVGAKYEYERWNAKKKSMNISDGSVNKIKALLELQHEEYLDETWNMEYVWAFKCAANIKHRQNTNVVLNDSNNLLNMMEKMCLLKLKFYLLAYHLKRVDI